MSDQPQSTVNPKIDMSTPSVARMYDYVLNGKDNFASDRAAVDGMMQVAPEIFQFCMDNRAYLGRAVDFLARQGIDQFLDLGAGLPTVENTHHVAQRVNPDARVVYVDNDPIVLAHGRALLAENENTTVMMADIRNADEIVASEEAQRLIDFEQPVCVMLVSLLHCIPDADDPFGIVRRLFDRLAPGSALVFSQIVSDDPETAKWLTDVVLSLGTEWGRVRSRAEVERVFDGLELVEPGVVDCATWRNPAQPPSKTPSDPNQKLWEYAGVAIKR
ncbi:MAG TPA: SAM-dependent methyltransferase [Jiangellaceae bacterium]